MISNPAPPTQLHNRANSDAVKDWKRTSLQNRHQLFVVLWRGWNRVYMCACASVCDYVVSVWCRFPLGNICRGAREHPGDTHQATDPVPVFVRPLRLENRYALSTTNALELLQSRVHVRAVVSVMYVCIWLVHHVCRWSLCLQGFDMFTPFSVGLFYLLYRCFEQVSLFKPVTSRPANSER